MTKDRVKENMGASESTERSNGTEEEERRGGPGTGGSSTGPGSAIAMAAAGAAGAAVAAWSVYTVLSDSNTTIRFKMNTDGACRPSGSYPGTDPEQVMRGPSGYGGILRDHNGRWVRGFYGFIGVTDCLTAEFHGILQGLLLLDKPCYKESVLECDSTAAVEWINYDETKDRRRTPIINDCWDIITSCRELKKKNGITICSISRDANKCADKLANMGIDRGESETGETHMEIVDLPLEIKDIVDREAF